MSLLNFDVMLSFMYVKQRNMAITTDAMFS
jgi:hypothetical protein